MHVNVELGGNTILPFQTLQKVQMNIGQIISLVVFLLHQHTVTHKLFFATGLNPLHNGAFIH